MSPDKDLMDLHKRLDDLEKRLAEKEAQIGRAGPVSDHQRGHIDDIQARVHAVRGKLPASGDDQWDTAKHELEADVEALTHVFENWATHVDKEFKPLG